MSQLEIMVCIFLIYAILMIFFLTYMFENLKKSTKSFFEEFTKVRRICDRCGADFDPDESEDDTLMLCEHCVKALKNNPNDEYFHRDGSTGRWL